jgi:hypothetical protein
MTGQVVALRDDQRPKTLADLKNALDRLNERDRGFADSLIAHGMTNAVCPTNNGTGSVSLQPAQIQQPQSPIKTSVI